jgi:DNA helicase-2/ATP-dependent DNA helicase PcrA
LSATEAAATVLDLDDEQRAAVRAAPGPLLILAGPGAGKTRTLTHRLAHLVATRAVAAREVLCITFTNRAATELAERVAVLLGPEAARAVTLGTFHAVCHRMVRAHPERLGRSAAFSIYDSADSRRLCTEATKGSPLGPEEVQRAIALAKARLWTPERLATRARTARQRAIAEVWARVEDSLRRADALDFDDLVADAERLLEDHTDLRAHYAERWRAVLVDEFQDVSPAQYRWVALLCAEHRSRSSGCGATSRSSGLHSLTATTARASRSCGRPRPWSPTTADACPGGCGAPSARVRRCVPTR